MLPGGAGEEEPGSTARKSGNPTYAGPTPDRRAHRSARGRCKRFGHVSAFTVALMIETDIKTYSRLKFIPAFSRAVTGF